MEAGIFLETLAAGRQEELGYTDGCRGDFILRITTILAFHCLLLPAALVLEYVTVTKVTDRKAAVELQGNTLKLLVL